MVKNPPTNASDLRDTGMSPGSGRSPAGGHGNPLQYSCLENPMDGGAWRATVHRVTKESDMTEATKRMHTHIPSWRPWKAFAIFHLFNILKGLMTKLRVHRLKCFTGLYINSTMTLI